MTSDIPALSWCTTNATTTSSASPTTPAVIVSNYVSGTSWRRIWSDGWIEQGGEVTGTADAYVTVSITEMKNTDYFVCISVGDYAADNWYNYTDVNARNFQVGLLTTTSFKVFLNKYSGSYPSLGKKRWMVCGYKK